MKGELTSCTTVQEVLKTQWTSCYLNGHNGRNVRKMTDFGVKMILVAFLLQSFDIFCCFDLVENSQNLGVKTGKKDKKNLEISRFRGFLVEISGIEPLTS